VIGDPVVFEIWRPPGGPLVASVRKRVQPSLGRMKHSLLTQSS